MAPAPHPSPPLFAIGADALLSHGRSGGPLSQALADKRADWLAQVAHAPPWRLTRQGLQFDVAPMDAPTGFATHFIGTDSVRGAALSLTLDPFSIAGASAAPILQGLAELTADLAEELCSEWVAWMPARIAYPLAFLQEQLAAWRAGGLIPLLAFVQFTEDAGGAQVTRGLAFFGLPELRLTATPAMAKGDAVRRMIRMAYAMLADAQLGESRSWEGEYDGLSPGERMTVRRRGDMVNLISRMPDGSGR